MNAHHARRLVAAALLAATVLALASPAAADRGRRRYKGVECGSPVIVERSSSVGPALAGLVGGFILGNAVASPRTVVVHEHRHRSRPVVVYRYRDPYCDTWYDSLDECSFRHHRHPRIIQVIDVRSGHEVRRLRQHGGDWDEESFDDDEDFED